MPPVTRDQMIVVAESVATADLGGETVVLDPASGSYFGLNEVGTRIFELAAAPRSVGEIEAILLDEYDVTKEQIWADVSSFIRQLVDKGLLQLV